MNIIESTYFYIWLQSKYFNFYVILINIDFVYLYGYKIVVSYYHIEIHNSIYQISHIILLMSYMTLYYKSRTV